MRAAEGEIKESRGGPLDEAGVRATMFTKEERREGMGGFGTRDKAWASRADRMPGKGKAHSAQGLRVRHDATATRKWGAKGPNTDDVRKACSEITRHTLRGQLNTGLGT